MKKTGIIASVFAAALAVALAGCAGSSQPAKVYNASDAAQTPGYEGDCWDSYIDTLVLNSDGTYTMSDGDYILQQSGVIVAYKNVYYTGTYEVGEVDGEGNQQVTLSAPTEATYVEGGTATSSADDPSILEDYAEQTVTVNDTTHVMTYAG